MRLLIGLAYFFVFLLSLLLVPVFYIALQAIRAVLFQKSSIRRKVYGPLLVSISVTIPAALYFARNLYGKTILLGFGGFAFLVAAIAWLARAEWEDAGSSKNFED